MACQSEQLIPGLAASASSVTWSDAGVHMQFHAIPDRLEKIVRVIDRERHCCRFLRFELTVPPGEAPFQLGITGPEGTVAFLESILGPRDAHAG